jgi:predicted glycogen debranching enzyme
MIHGTMNGIIMDSSSGLIFSPAHFTWMDTNFPAGTPRQGFPIEIQSLWYRALKLVAQIAPSGMKAYYRKLARQVKKAIVDLFFLKEIGYMADCLVARPGDRATDAEKDDALRPNQLLGLTMGAIEDDEIGRKIIFACEELLIPGGIRSLADRPLKRPLDIIHHGRKLTDPEKPYKGKYQGDEDTQRKPAYHNGTAWTWLFPVFCEAYALVFGDEGIRTAGAYLGSLTQVLNRGCVGHIPEILDGDFPHLFRGCDAQAWGISETARVWKRLFTVSGSDGHFSMRFPSKDAMMV